MEGTINRNSLIIIVVLIFISFFTMVFFAKLDSNRSSIDENSSMISDMEDKMSDLEGRISDIEYKF